MDKYLEANRELWDAWAPLHANSEFYDIEAFISGKYRLPKIQVEELGDIKGKKLLHLMCHIGLDTLTLARFGAEVTGMDFSEESINTAKSFSKEINVPSKFICCNIYDLPDHL